MKNIIIYKQFQNVKPNMDYAHLFQEKIELFLGLMILNFKIVNKF